MKTVTFIKLTKEESIVLARADEILSELEDNLPEGDDLIETVGNALAYLGIAMEKLEDMGNDFRIPLGWSEWVKGEVASNYEPDDDPQPEELLEDCWEFTAERPDYPKSLDYSWKGTVPESY